MAPKIVTYVCARTKHPCDKEQRALKAATWVSHECKDGKWYLMKVKEEEE